MSFLVAQGATTAPCPLPIEISPSYFPSGWTRKGDIRQWNDATGDWIECQEGTFVGQLEAGPKTIALTEKFQCDPQSKKWISPTNGFEAPPILTCAVAGSEATTGCKIQQYLPDNNTPTSIRIFGGLEAYCPSTQRLVLADDDVVIDRVECFESGGLNVYICNNAFWFSAGYGPHFKCAEAFCPIDNNLSNGTVLRQDLKPGAEKLLCTNVERLQWHSDSSDVASMECSVSGLDIKDMAGKSWKYPICKASLQCVTATCPIKNKLSNGTIEDVILAPQRERYCPVGQIARFAYGADLKFLECNGAGLHAYLADHSVVTYQKANPPTLECIAACNIMDGVVGRTLTPGREQFCPEGEIVQLEDGTPAKDITCSTAGLNIVKQDGSIITTHYPESTPLQCGPGVCERSRECDGPRTCPTGGVWSEWTVSGTCSTTGSCGKTRTCSIPFGCGDPTVL